MNPDKLPDAAQAFQRAMERYPPNGGPTARDRSAYCAGFSDAIALARQMLKDAEAEKNEPVFVNMQEVETLLQKMSDSQRIKLITQFCRVCGEENDKCSCRDERIEPIQPK